MKLTALFRRSRFPVLGVVLLALVTVIAAHSGASAAGFGGDDRVSRAREKGTPYGAIGLVEHKYGGGAGLGTGFLVAPCHVMTAYHVVASNGKVSAGDTATFYVGEGDVGPDYTGGRRYAESAEAHPVAWGDYVDDDDGKIAKRIKAVQANGWNDWVLLKLDRCLGDPAEGWGYLKLAPQSTRDLARSGLTLDAIVVGLPKDKSEKKLTEDPDCRVIGQMSGSGWQHDCLTLPGNSGGPILERNAKEPGVWPRVLGINVSLILLDGLETEAAESALVSADDPSYFNLLSNAVPVSAFINKVAQYLPQDPEISAYIARQSRDSGYSRADDMDYDASIADLTAALKARPQDAELYVRRGLWLAASDKTDAAIADFSKALEQQPGYPAALLSRSESLSARDDNAKGDLENAIADLTALIDRFKDSAELIMSRGYIYMRDRKFDLAAADFTEFLRLRPESSAALRARAGAYADLKQYDKAAEDYDAAIERDPDLPLSYVARGNFHSQLGQDTEALADFARAITLYPGSSAAHSGRAYALLQQGDYRGAIKSFDQAMKYDDKASYALGGRASVYQVIGDHEASLRDYKKAVELDPSEPFIKLLYFVEQLHAGQAEAAKKNFVEFAADPRYEDWPRTLARFFAGEIDAAAVERVAAEAKTDFDKMARAFDRDFYLGQAALIAGDNPEAVKRLGAVVATGERQYMEYNIAAAEVAKLKGVAQTDTPPANTTQN
ncbi:tetratricopeptide repeat protein [Dongia sp.]|uniref:tetratricopeptide repeat protein n=1 Tax=Dongia sp. TaxID=1977262 RepID=UPI0037537EB1